MKLSPKNPFIIALAPPKNHLPRTIVRPKMERNRFWLRDQLQTRALQPELIAYIYAYSAGRKLQAS